LFDPDYSGPNIFHWLMDDTGHGAGSARFGAGILYNIGDQTAPYHGNPYSVVAGQGFPGSSSVVNQDYSFNSATDAQLWLAYSRTIQSRLGLGDQSLDLQRQRSAIELGLTSSGIMGFRITAGRSSGPNGGAWIDIDTNHLYPAYQFPAVMLDLNRGRFARAQVEFIKESQRAYVEFCRAKACATVGEGPFMPLRADGTWTYNGRGADTNTYWGGFNGRVAFALSAYSIELMQMGQRDPIAEEALRTHLDWTINNTRGDGPNTTIPVEFENGERSRDPRQLGMPTLWGYGPHEFGLEAMASIEYSALLSRIGEQGSAERYRAYAERLLITMLAHRSPRGNFPNADPHHTRENGNFTFRDAIAGLAFIYYDLYTPTLVSH
jgi:hypothetical protein